MRTDLFSPVFNNVTRHEVVYASIYGSQSYDMAINDDTYQSDIDYKAIIVPTLKDLVYNKKPISQVVEIDGGQIDVKDIRKFMETLLKCNPAYVECFITPYYTGNSEFEEIRQLVPKMVWELRENFIRACFGMLVEKHVALCHPYPSIKDKIDKYGFDCYDEDTLFLTKNGWKKYIDISDDEELGTMNPETKELEFQKQISRVEKNTCGEVYDIETFDTHFIVTGTHNLFTSNVLNINYNGHAYNEKNSNWKISPLKEEMSSNFHKHIYSFPINNNKEYDISDDDLNLIGAYVSEGYINFRKNKSGNSVKCARIYQTCNGKIEFCEMMKTLKLKRYRYNNTCIWTTDRRKAEWLHDICGCGSSNIRLPKWFIFLSKRQSEVLLNSLMLGDGCFNNCNRDVYYTKNKKLGEDVLTLALLSGKHATLLGNEMGYNGNGSFGQHRMFHVTVKPKSLSPSYIFLKENKNVKKIDNYCKKVVCFEVKNGLLVTMYNGKTAVQGNSKQLHHMMRLLKMMQDFDETGKVILVPDNKDYLIDIKRGNYSLEEAKFMAKETECAARVLKEELLSRYLTQCHTFDAVERIRQIGFEITEKSIIAEVC